MEAEEEGEGADGMQEDSAVKDYQIGEERLLIMAPFAKAFNFTYENLAVNEENFQISTYSVIVKFVVLIPCSHNNWDIFAGLGRADCALYTALQDLSHLMVDICSAFWTLALNICIYISTRW